ncbi:dermonecrotic toxin domain-containing protein [Pseudomonas sp. 18175]|uniref:dermonecrotic toxin domain-containing protein n=1 Tax=Pseudomonas sp. 18175 TaxID=3390056 RepID=UPI003D24EF0E
MPATPSSETLPPALPGEQGQHYSFIRQVIPDCLVQSSPARRLALKQTAPQVPAWYDAASQASKDQLNTLLQARCESLNRLERTLGKTQALDAFAQPLLVAALKAQGFELDVNLTWLRLYSPAEDAFGVRTGGFKVRTYSLLQAALNNFEAREAEPDYFNSASGFITAPDERGHFERHTTTLAIDAFVSLCRTLDLGAKYQTYLTNALHPGAVVPEGVLREQFIRYHQDAFAAAALLAQLKGDISDSDYALLLRVLAGEQKIMLGDKQVWYRAPCLMNLQLQGCLIIDPCVEHRYGDWFIAYIPDHPEHPIKRYASLNEFRNDLTARLKAGPQRVAERSETTSITNFQRFFSQFVAYKDRPYYFRRLTELVVDAPPQPIGAQWLRSEWGQVAAKLLAPTLSTLTLVNTDPQPQVRVPITDPDFYINIHSISGLWVAVDLWPQHFESWRQRQLDDASAQAVSTADADEAASARRLQHYLNIGLLGVNVLAMVIPPLGEAMAVVMVGQMLYEVLDGVIELSEGDREAGWAHITDVVENLAALVAGGAAFHFTAVPFIENLKRVTLPSGKTRLWNPDLAPYEHTRAIPEGSVPNEHGVHQVNGEAVIALEDKRFKVRQKPADDGYVIEHPSRPDAYQPTLEHNGAGAWRHELERPLTWAGPRLMRRLGPTFEGFSDVQLEQIRQVSDIDEDVLRRVHVESEPVPAVLLDTARQFRAYASAMQVAEGIGSGSLPDTLCGYAATLAVELPGWPVERAVQAFDEPGLTGPSVKYGSAEAVPSDTLQISRRELMGGKLPERIVDFLSDTQLEQLVGRYTPRTRVARIAAVKAQLQARANLVRARLMRSVYADQQPLTDAAEALVQRDFKSLPTLMVREMLAELPAAQRAALKRATRLPLDLAQKARLLQQQVRLSHAYEGLFLDALANRDTEALVLNSLPNLPGWSDNLRLEVREGGLEGELRASFGPQSGEKKILLRVADGRYQAFDDRGQELHGVNGLYGALQHALPDAHRKALGLPHVGQGEQLQALIRAKALPREQLRRVLGMRPERLPIVRWPLRLPGERLGYPLSGRGAGQETWRQITEERVRSLYPAFSTAEVRTFIENLGQDRELKLGRLEKEFKQLSSRLRSWKQQLSQGVSQQEQAADAFRARRHVRSLIARELIEAWQRTGTVDVNVEGVVMGQFFDLADEELLGELNTLPALSANFDHVTRLDVSNTGLSQNIDGFLGHFTRLRRLDLSRNRLEALPASVGEMRQLTDLDLSDNRIVLTVESANALSQLAHMGFLSLERNPLTVIPNIGRMPELVVVILAKTGINTWPAGVFDLPRGRTFNLDLSENVLASIPQVELGSDAAETIARTTISEEPEYISAQNLEQVRNYRESVGLDPNRRSPARGMLDSFSWRAGLDDEQWQAKSEVWERLEDELGSEPFFDELRKLATSADALSEDEAARLALTRRVWEMVEAAAEDWQLRRTLFRMAQAPTSCVDAGAQLFNAMGVEVLIKQAYELAAVDLIEARLLELAQGKSRLNELGRIAVARVNELVKQGRKFPEYDEEGLRITHRDSQGNALRDIDEVEIHMIYPTRLAEPLDLPWQSRNMMFREPDVNEAMIEEARQRVLALEEGPLLEQQIISQPFWADFVKLSYPKLFQQFRLRAEALLDQGDVPPGSYTAGMRVIEADQRALILKLTREAMQRAKLQRTEIPFQVVQGNDDVTQNRK